MQRTVYMVLILWLFTLSCTKNKSRNLWWCCLQQFCPDIIKCELKLYVFSLAFKFFAVVVVFVVVVVFKWFYGFSIFIIKFILCYFILPIILLFTTFNLFFFLHYYLFIYFYFLLFLLLFTFWSILQFNCWIVIWLFVLSFNHFTILTLPICYCFVLFFLIQLSSVFVFKSIF